MKLKNWGDFLGAKYVYSGTSHKNSRGEHSLVPTVWKDSGMKNRDMGRLAGILVMGRLAGVLERGRLAGMEPREHSNHPQAGIKKTQYAYSTRGLPEYHQNSLLPPRVSEAIHTHFQLRIRVH